MKKYLVALPTFRGTIGFNCRTILVSAKDEQEAICIVKHKIPSSQYIGQIKEVNY